MPTKKQIEKFKKQGQYPRKTKNWLRYRQQEPEKFSEFRIKTLSPARKLVVGKLISTGKWVVQEHYEKAQSKNLASYVREVQCRPSSLLFYLMIIMGQPDFCFQPSYCCPKGCLRLIEVNITLLIKRLNKNSL